LKTLVLDNGSPFTTDILNLLDKLDQKYDCKKFSEVSFHMTYGRVILSGRKKNDQRINSVNSSIIRTCHNNDIPLLGICYGAEIIALTFGGSIRRIEHVQGSTKITVFRKNDLMEENMLTEVYESHSYNIARLPPEFISLARSYVSPYELFYHTTKKIYGTQFHPERSGEVGYNLFRNFVRL
jgi:GMP synthase (glutamine-hydrolysing)